MNKAFYKGTHGLYSNISIPLSGGFPSTIIMTTISEDFPNLVLTGTPPFILYVSAHQIPLREAFLYSPRAAPFSAAHGILFFLMAAVSLLSYNPSFTNSIAVSRLCFLDSKPIVQSLYVRTLILRARVTKLQIVKKLRIDEWKHE